MGWFRARADPAAEALVRVAVALERLADQPRTSTDPLLLEALGKVAAGLDAAKAADPQLVARVASLEHELDGVKGLTNRLKGRFYREEASQKQENGVAGAVPVLGGPGWAPNGGAQR